MGYRILVAVFTMALLVSCAAFDNSSTPLEGFSPDEVARVPGTASAYSGHYAGTMTLDSNTCSSVTAEFGAAIPLEFDVTQSGTTVSVTFADDSVAAGSLDGDKTTLMTSTGNAKQVYYFTFAGNQAKGSAEVVEADEAGQYGAACASYTVLTSKAE